MPPSRAVFFLLAVPGLIGLLLGATRAGMALHLPWHLGVLFWTVSSIGVWFCLYAGSVVSARVLRPWSLPVWAILLSGAVVGSVPGRYLIFSVAHVLRGSLEPGHVSSFRASFELSADFLAYYVQGWAGVYVTWIAVGLLFNHRLTPENPSGWGADAAGPGGERSPSEVTSRAGPSELVAVRPTHGPALQERLRVEVAQDVLAVEAEDHYVRVHTRSGSTLVHARFSDVIHSLSPLNGVRVHRSYWVNPDCVTDVQVQGKGLLLTLSNGLKVPVSHGYKELAREAGLSPRR